MVNMDPTCNLPPQPLRPMAAPDPHHWSAARIAGAYLIAGLLWIGLSDLTLVAFGALTANGFHVSAGKGVVFVLLSTGFVFWLCRREYRNTLRTMTLLRAVVEGTADAVFVKDRSGRYQLLNAAGAQVIGKPVTEILGRVDREFFSTEDGERLMAKDREIMASGGSVTLEETLTLAGVTRTYLATKAPYFDTTGAVAGLIGISRDVTDRAQVEAALRETDARLREAQRIARLGSWSWEPPTNRVWWSDAEFELFGLDRAAVQPSFESFLALLHPDDRATALMRVENMLAGANELADDLRIIRADGSYIWIHSQARATRDSDGALVRVEGTDQDITAMRLASESRREAEARLREQEMLVREAAELAKVGGWGFDPVTMQADWTPEVAQMYGLPTDSPLGMEESLAFYSPEQQPALASAMADAIRDGKPHDLELKLTAADGEIKWVRTICRPIVEGGRVVRVRGSLQDITDRKRVESELRSSEERYRMLFDSNPHPMWVYDVDSLKFLAVNDAAILTYGYARDEFLNMTLREIRPPEDVPRLEASVARTQRGFQRSAQWRHRRKDGTVFDADVSSHDLPEEYGRSRLVLALDITDRKQTEAELSASERRLRLALEAAGAIAFVWEIPTDTVTRYFSKEPALPATAERVGTLDEVRTKIHPDDLSAFDARLSSCLADGTEYRNEYRVVRPDGSTAFLEEYGYLDRAAEGSPLRLTGMSIDVTDRVSATESLRASEERLRLSEERLREAAQVAGFGVFEHDHLTGEIYWSPRLREIYGVDQETRTDLNIFFNSIHPSDREGVEAAVGRAHDPNGDGRFDIEHRLNRLSDGEVRWLATHSQTRFAGNGQDRRPVRTVGATVDTTEARLAAEALRSSEARYRQLVDILPTAIFVHGDDKILYGNPSFLMMLGASSPDELLGRSPFEIAHPSVHETLRQRRKETERTGSALPGCEIQVVRCDGRSVPVHVVSAPISGYGQPATLEALSDLTEREQVTTLLRSVLDSVDDAILTIDANGIVTSVNQATERLFGYVAAELLGRNVSALMPEPNGREQEQYIADYLRTGVAKTIGIGREVEGKRKDGTNFPAELTITEFSRDGERNFTWVLRDVTARRQLEEQFRQAQKMEAVGRLAGGVAHDFNNLLTVINGYSELLLADLSTDHSMQEPLAAIHDAGDRAARLTKQLLTLSRKSMIEPRLVDLNELVTESANLFRRLIGEDITLLVLADPAPVKVILDPGQLEQVLMNLVVNARDAMPTGGRLTIETRIASIDVGIDRSLSDMSSGRYALLRVTDNGCGMNAEVQDKIFEPFFTTKGIGKGTGLGLAVVHGVVQQSGGSITVESVEGIGTTFKILLPAAEDDANEAAAGETRLSLQGRETVLVAEDEEAVRTLVRFTLEEQGYTVLTASGGLDALEVIRMHPGQIDLLVTDMIMPGISGRELAEEARKVRLGLRVIYMSGYTDDALVRYGLQGTSDQFVQKPFTPLGLIRKIRSILDQPS